jgi:adenylate kinase family enzyme
MIRKIAVIGCPGAGKSTLTVQLAEITGLPVVHLDTVYHQPEAPFYAPERKSAWRAYMQTLVTGDAWIIDGNYQSTLPLRIDAADAVIFLDFPRWLCLWRVLWRRLQQRAGRAAAGGNPEWLSLDFLRFIWTYRRQERAKILALLHDKAATATGTVIILTSPRAVDRFLREPGAMLAG